MVRMGCDAVAIGDTVACAGFTAAAGEAVARAGTALGETTARTGWMVAFVGEATAAATGVRLTVGVADVVARAAPQYAGISCIGREDAQTGRECELESLCGKQQDTT